MTASCVSQIQLHLIVVIDPEFDDVLTTLALKKPPEWEVQRGTKVLLPYARLCRNKNIAHTIVSLKAPHVGAALCEYVKENSIERMYEPELAFSSFFHPSFFFFFISSFALISVFWEPMEEEQWKDTRWGV